MMIFINGTEVKFGGVNDTSIIEGHVCNYLLIFFKIKHLYCIFSDYINNTHSFKNIHTMPRNIRRKVEITWNAGILRWLPLKFGELFFHETFFPCFFKNIFIDYAITVVPFPPFSASCPPLPPTFPPIVHVHGSYI